MTLLLIILGLIIVVNCAFMGSLISDVTTRGKHEEEPGNILWTGIISFFQFILSAFGVSDFAIGAAVYSKLKWVSAKNLPGTVNAAAVIPVAIMAIIYITTIEIDLLTLLVPIVAQMIGAYFAPRFVVKMPVKPIRIFLALGMIVTVLRIAAEGFGFFPAGGNVTSLGAAELALLGVLCFIFGTLNNFGLGSFAPTMATLYAFGFSPAAAFPIMMGACAFSIPIAGMQFVKHQSYSRRITVVSAICGSVGVLFAAYVLKSVDLLALKWVVAAILLYSAGDMIYAAFKNKSDETAQPKNAGKEDKMSNVNILTNVCVVLILICTVSLINVFVINTRLIVSESVKTSISEHNARVRGNVQAYLREQEIFILNARAGAAHFINERPVDRAGLRAYLEEVARMRDDISTLYVTSNELWNGPDGFAVFHRPWDTEDGEPPPEWNNTIRPWYIAAKEAQGAVAYSKPFVDALTGDIILALSANVYDNNGNDIGVISEDVTIETLNTMLQSPVSIEGHEVFLIDAEGVFVVHPNKMMAAQANFFNEVGLGAYRDSVLSADQYFATHGGMAVYSMSIPNANWFVVSIIPTANIYTTANNQIFSIFLTPIAIIVFMLFIVLITLQKERKDKEELNRLSIELRHASKAKSEFLAKMSHEIRTPMNAIIGMSEVALRRDSLPEVQHDLKTIKSAGTSLVSIINDILDISKIESGKMEIVPGEYCVASLVNDVTTIIKTRLTESPVRFEVKIDENIPGVLFGDAVRIRQALLNILGNAVKFTQEGFITFSLHGKIVDDENVVLTMSVSDTGKGIKHEDIDKLFNEFIQVDTASNRGIEGTGLGLAITKHLVKAMGGDVSVKSEYGKGSEFTITLPQKIHSREPLTITALEKHEESAGEQITFSAPSARVLVVDDVATNLKVAEGLMQPYGMKIDTCLSGKESLSAVRAFNYDAIFMDHMMPEMDGVETVKRIRAMGEENEKFAHLKDVPIIALTANALTGVKEMFLQNGFTDFLSKPIDTAKLNAALKKAINAEKQIAVKSGGDKNSGDANIKIDGVDVKLGMRRTGGTIDGYTQTLAMFFESGADTVDAIKKSLDNGDVSLYVTRVHGLKSAAANIGASALSEAAGDLEDAGRRGDKTFMDAYTPKLISELEKILTNVKISLSAIKKERACANTDKNTLKPILADLKTAIDNIDIAAINAIASKLREYENLEEIKGVLISVLNGDYDVAGDLIEKILI